MKNDSTDTVISAPRTGESWNIDFSAAVATEKCFNSLSICFTDENKWHVAICIIQFIGFRPLIKVLFVLLIFILFLKMNSQSFLYSFHFCSNFLLKMIMNRVSNCNFRLIQLLNLSLCVMICKLFQLEL